MIQQDRGKGFCGKICDAAHAQVSKQGIEGSVGRGKHCKRPGPTQGFDQASLHHRFHQDAEIRVVNGMHDHIGRNNDLVDSVYCTVCSFNVSDDHLAAINHHIGAIFSEDLHCILPGSSVVQRGYITGGYIGGFNIPADNMVQENGSQGFGAEIIHAADAQLREKGIERIICRGKNRERTCALKGRNQTGLGNGLGQNREPVIGRSCLNDIFFLHNGIIIVF